MGIIQRTNEADAIELERKLCPICGKELTAFQISKGIKTCSNSCGNRLRYQNPENRRKTGEIHRKVWQNKDFRQKMSKSIKTSWENTYEKRVEAIRVGRNKPEVIQKQSENLRAYKLSDEGRKKNSERMRLIWSDEEKSKNLREALAKNNANINVRLKQYATQKKNKSFGKSKAEDASYQHLCSLYSSQDIERQYASIVYPYKADFYIKSLNLYIECNYNWTHGSKRCHEPFDSNNEMHKKELELLKEKAKASKYYQNAIYQWTDLDVRKRQCAIDNKLNWLCFYSENAFYNYFNKGQTNEHTK